MQTLEKDREWFEDDVLDRFLRYVQVHTTSDRHGTETPTTQRQWDLIRMLESELRGFGIDDITVDERGYLIARLPAASDGKDKSPAGREGGPTIGYMAHVDTTEDYTGENVNPQVHRKYDGGVISAGSLRLDPADFPELLDYKGETVVTTDGTTLLGADDKAGVAEVMTAVRYLLAHPEIPRPAMEIIFTPDEETGKGMDRFPLELLRSQYCYTVDGGDEGTIEAESFTAYKATLEFQGVMIHPGTARGKMVNAARMAAAFITMLPRSESPEATDGRYGFYHPLLMSGSGESAKAEILIRDFDGRLVEQRIAAIHAFADAVRASFPGGKITVTIEKQYRNMYDRIAEDPHGLELLPEAARQTGVAPVFHSIRGGTDGSRLTEMGVPTPNLFAGGHNMHGRFEWVALPSMVRAAKTLVNLAELWASKSP